MNIAKEISKAIALNQTLEYKMLFLTIDSMLEFDGELHGCLLYKKGDYWGIIPPRKRTGRWRGFDFVIDTNVGL